MGQGFLSRRFLILSGASIVVGIALVVVFWGWLSNGESGSTTIRNLALILAGFVALPLAMWRGIVADRQAATAQQGLLNERYQSAADMLGSEVLSVRLAGITALQRLAAEHPEQYHIQVLALFCAFIRLPTRDQHPDSGDSPIRLGHNWGVRQDVQSVLEVIVSRDEARRNLERRADVKLDLRGSSLRGAQILDADLSGAMFHRSILSGTYFFNVDLTDANFAHADLIEAQFYQVAFTRINLSSANLSGAMLQDVEMTRLNLHNVNMSGANLGRANLSQTILQDSDLANVWLDGAELADATFLRANLSQARLDRADCTGATFLEADLTGANLSGANLSRVQFSNRGLQPARGLTQSQVDQAWSDPNAPPILRNVLDADTGNQLVWREQTSKGNE